MPVAGSPAVKFTFGCLITLLIATGCATDTDREATENIAISGDSEPSASTISDTVALSAPQAPPVSEPKPAPLLPVPNPTSLIGYDETALESLLGLPSFTRREPPAELWQYRNSHCTLDLFLYEAVSGAYNVEHIEFREVASSLEAQESCLRTIIQGKAPETSAS